VLVVEVLSPHTRLDHVGLKGARLCRAGCPHCWLVDPESPSVTCLALCNGVYTEVAVSENDRQVELREPFPFRLNARPFVSDGDAGRPRRR
jgi:Uma2 family endonuclease